MTDPRRYTDPDDMPEHALEEPECRETCEDCGKVIGFCRCALADADRDREDGF